MDRILIVEDDRLFREMFSDLLRAQGYTVDSAACGGDAMRMLADQRYGLVITDLVLPDTNGMDILATLKQTDPTIDVIMVTGNGNIESAIFALKHGARDYLLKPVNSDEFIHSVALCLEQRRLLDENEELKGMINLFHSSQVISSCLDIERVYHLVLDAVAREIGLNRGMGLYLIDDGFQLKEVKGLSTAVAEPYRDLVLAHIASHPPGSRQMMERITLDTEQVTHPSVRESGIREAYLFFVRSETALLGVIAIFNEVGEHLPDFLSRKKNVAFLLEQSRLAIENAKSYTLAKDMLFIDDLSGLFNHRYLEVALDRELKRIERYASHLAVLFLDIDFFKEVNDTHGHLVGSKVLKEMAVLLQKSVRDVDVVIRYGGDEYTIILVETTPDMAGIVAERIRSLVAAHPFLAVEGYAIRLTCSIGYSCCPDDTVSKQQLLEMADKAMYVGKSSGKNRVVRFEQAS